MSNRKEKIVRIYDDILSGLDHISSLNINGDNLKKVLEFDDKREIDPDIEMSHNRFISEVIISSQESDIASVKNYIMYPDFHVLTSIPNKEYFYKDTSSLEKSLIIGLKSEVNFIINDPRFRPLDNTRNIMVLSVERVSFSFATDFYKISFKTIPSSLFYEYYARLIAPFKVYRQITDGDYMRIKSLAVRDALNMLGDSCEVLEGEFTLKKQDYYKLKEYLKHKYDIEYEDEFMSVIGGNASVWNNIGAVRYDNRVEGNLFNETKPIPLLYQRSKYLTNKKSRLS